MLFGMYCVCVCVCMWVWVGGGECMAKRMSEGAGHMGNYFCFIQLSCLSLPTRMKQVLNVMHLYFQKTFFLGGGGLFVFWGNVLEYLFTFRKSDSDSTPDRE